jgi:hypothetical protein
MNSDSDDCTIDDFYPFNLTHKTGITFCHGLDSPMLDSRDCNSCCWICFPVTIAIDLVTLIPFSGIYFGKKCCKYCKKDSVIAQVTPIVTQPAKLPTPIQ